MTNQDQLAAELKAKLKEGIKPSQLKRSLSANDLTVRQAQPEQAPLQAQLHALQAQLTSKEQALTEAQTLITQLNTELQNHCEKQLTQLKQTDPKDAKIKQLTQQVQVLKQKLHHPDFGSPLWAERFMRQVFWGLLALTALTLLGQWLLA